MLITFSLAAASMMALALPQPGGCEDTFRKSGNPVTGLRFASQIGGEARKSSISIDPRYAGRAFTLYGPVASVSKTGESYRVDFKLVDNMLASLAPGTGYRVEVSCLLAPGESTLALGLKPDAQAELTGVFDIYEPDQSRVWLRDCRTAK